MSGYVFRKKSVPKIKLIVKEKRIEESSTVEEINVKNAMQKIKLVSKQD